MDDIWDVLIIGGGPAGLSAALMLGRANRRVCVVDAGEPRNRFAAHMHGVLGHEGMPPSELVARGRVEAAGYGVEFVAGHVASVDASTGVEVTLRGGDVLRARALILATGLRDDLPDIPGLAPRWGIDVLHCPYCHGWEVRGRRLGVLATSPTSLHQALLVRQWSDDVTVFTDGLGALAPDTRHRLRSRGVRLVASQVVAVETDDGTLTVRTDDSTSVPLDALFTGGTLHPLDDALASLDLARTDTPMGSFLAVDATGMTSSPRIWAAGNVVTPNATVAMSMGAGAMAGAAVNATLVSEDFDHAVAASAPAHGAPSAVDFWEERYAGSSAVWSGRVNATLAAVVSERLPSTGRALDIGCGEGGDVVWLAQKGWDATGVDISATAIARARAAATDRGFGSDRVRFVVDDLDGPDNLSHLEHDDDPDESSALDRRAEPFDLVTASFLHSPVALSRTEILRRAASHVAPGGHLLIVSHLAPPPWSALAHDHGAPLLAPADEIEALALDPEHWEVIEAEVRPRAVVAPTGESAEIEDAVILLRRR